MNVADNVALGPRCCTDRTELPAELSAVAESGSRARHARHWCAEESATCEAAPDRRERKYEQNPELRGIVIVRVELDAIRDAFPACRVSLRQRERNRAYSQKQKQIKSASNKMRFDGGINLFFHLVLFFRLSS